MRAHLYRLWHWWATLPGTERVTLIVEILGFLVVAAYTTVAALQWHAMVSANRNATRALQITQRAYVNVKRIVMSSPLENGQPLPELRVEYTNAGRLPALDFFIWPFFETGPPKALEKDFANLPFPDFVHHTGQILPIGVTRYENVGTPPGMHFPSDVLVASQVIRGEREWGVSVKITYCDGFGWRHDTIETFHYQPQWRDWEPLSMGWKHRDRRDPDCYDPSVSEQTHDSE